MKTVEFCAYDKDWPTLFQHEVPKIQAALGDNCTEIHHIGSTAVPYLSAKPIIDMLAVVKNILLVEDIPGYKGRGELLIPFRRYFSTPTHHLHVYEDQNPEIGKYLLFRDFLINNPYEARRYEALKKELAITFKEDRPSYTKGKDKLIQDILKQVGYQGLYMFYAFHEREWSAYHRIIKEQIFARIPNVTYDPNHWTFQHPDHYRFVLTKGTEVIGSAHVELRANDAILRGIAIDELYQRQNYGSQFLKIIEKWVAHQKHGILFLHAAMPAVPFYKRSGFIEMAFEDPDNTSQKPRMDMGKIL